MDFSLVVVFLNVTPALALGWMPLFFFDTDIDGDQSIDDMGTPLVDLPTARREAMAALCMLAAELETMKDVVRATLKLRSETGETIMTLKMHLTVSPSDGAS